jgi:prepilin-type N-terminal cleavage/methylation domain-containing protein
MKNLLKTKRAEGFTIIEVMIVLAIAGLIMVIVFIAVPQLQRNQRDNARQSIANRTKAEIETYAGNNQGTYPFLNTCTGAGASAEWCDFITRYINSVPASLVCNNATVKVNVCDPTLGTNVITSALGVPAAFGAGNCTAAQTLTHGVVHVCYGAKCAGENLVASGTPTPSSRTYAVVMGLDRDGSGYCVDNG